VPPLALLGSLGSLGLWGRSIWAGWPISFLSCCARWCAAAST
jgi:hypothetical protein